MLRLMSNEAPGLILSAPGQAETKPARPLSHWRAHLSKCYTAADEVGAVKALISRETTSDDESKLRAMAADIETRLEKLLKALERCARIEEGTISAKRRDY